MKAAAKSVPARIKTILFATDFSDVASRAQSYATGLANRFGAKLIVVHAKEAPNYALPPETWRAADEADAFNRRKLQDSLDKSSPGLGSQIHVGEGPVWQVIESALEKSRADLIVLGTRGRTGGARLLLGLAHRVITAAACPVLTVRR
jgi:nucleotide-binding universal stress UspA family protein